MSELKFKKLSNRPIKAKKLSVSQFTQLCQGGIAILFDIDTEIGGFRFLHCVNKRYELSYVVLFFPTFQRSAPVAYEFQLKEFHMYVSYWIINLQVESGDLKIPPEKPTPIENLSWCMMEMVKNS